MRPYLIAGVIIVAVLASVVSVTPPFKKVSACGMGGPVSLAVGADWDLQTTVRDLQGTGHWVQAWTLKDQSGVGVLRLNAMTAKTTLLFGLRIPSGKRKFSVEVPRTRDIYGTADGFSYEVIWRKKANQALQPTAPRGRG